jgi:hypothetical protein
MLRFSILFGLMQPAQQFQQYQIVNHSIAHAGVCNEKSTNYKYNVWLYFSRRDFTACQFVYLSATNCLLIDSFMSDMQISTIMSQYKTSR